MAAGAFLCSVRYVMEVLHSAFYLCGSDVTRLNNCEVTGRDFSVE